MLLKPENVQRPSRAELRGSRGPLRGPRSRKTKRWRPLVARYEGGAKQTLVAHGMHRYFPPAEPPAKRAKAVVDLTDDDDAVPTPAPGASSSGAAPAPIAAAPQPQKTISRVTLPGGVLDDSLLARVDAIAQQSNCVGCDGRGLAQGIAAKFPWACAYAQRRRMPPANKFAIPEDRPKPGTIDARRGPSGTPLVINMFSQYEMGGPGKYRRVEFPPGVSDLAPQREAWFAQCLQAISQLPTASRPRSLAFPHQIGCGLAGGNWDRYERMIADFATANPEIAVTIAVLGGGKGRGGGGRGGGRGGGWRGGGGRSGH